MKRRDFITLLGGAAAAWPRGARATGGRAPGDDPVVGFLGLGSPGQASVSVRALREGLRNAGYIDAQMARLLDARGKRYVGVNVAIEFRWANFQNSLLPRLAADLVGRHVDVIVTHGSSSAALAAKAATSTIPITFAVAEDPVKYGLVASLDRPGGNVTGVASFGAGLAGKRVNLLLELAPQATKVGYLSDPSESPVFEDSRSDMLAAGRALGREIIVLEVRRLDFEAAFETLVEQRAGALIVGNYKLFAGERNRNKILELTARHNIPTMYPGRGYAVNGGLMSYDTDPLALFYQVGADYVGPLLDGAKPADLPVQQPSRFALVVNLKTAKTLGLTITPEFQHSVTEVIPHPWEQK
jgi:putative ABC transport system substrate-binding protein